MENLAGFISDYEDDEGVQQMQKYMNQIREAYQQLDCKESSLEVNKDDGEMIVLDGGNSCIFTQDSYNNLKSLINEIRGEIIS
jgi:peptidase E